MAVQFLTGNELNLELEKVFEKAERRLVLISPYISLHGRYESVLRTKLHDDKLEISLVFGKNEENPSRSMRKEDLEFFMQFPNITIRHEPRLHAKYYANDEFALITSMNLYRYSQDNNIEAGVLVETTTVEADIANRLMGRTDVEAAAAKCFERVIEQAKIIYKREPVYEKAMLGLTKKYVRSEVTMDGLIEFFTNERTISRPQGAPKPQTVSSTAPKPVSHGTGYCIRTGKMIPFNDKHPMCDEAYASWVRYKDPKYKEKFCHFSGEPSNGDTSFARPILSKNWNKAKVAHSF